MKFDVKHLAKLSRLKIDEAQEKKFEAQLETIIDMVEKLPEIKSNEALIDKNNPMICRKDIAENDYKRDNILSNAPQVKAGCVVVPKIID